MPTGKAVSLADHDMVFLVNMAATATRFEQRNLRFLRQSISGSKS